MLEVQIKHINKYLELIQITGAKCLVQLPDGKLLGDVDEFSSKKKSKRKPAKVVRRFYWQTNYPDAVEKISTLKPGEVFEQKPNKEHSLNELQTFFCNAAREKFGKGNYTTTRTKETIQVMRVA